MYINKSNFKRKLIASAVASCAMSGFAMPTLAQDSGMLEEVVVTGIRASLDRAMDVKRDSAGVVDAISAEDIGKFPDSNLAESLQRITGVSIDRRNGEGAEVTIRGFGSDNNMVLLNGRQMPGGTAFGGGSGAGNTLGGGSRAFDFSNLASESVGGVDVYKTGRASISSGGIGGTIDIKTRRPLDNPGLNATVGAKAVHDTTNVHGDDVTPEVSGLVSWTDDNEMFGVALSASYQERDSASAGFASNEWNIRTWGEGDSLYSMAPGGVVENAPDDGQMYTRPNDIRYSFSDRHRERTNAQLTLQFRPMDTLTVTGDYTYAENYLQENRHEQTFWYNNGGNVERIEFDDGLVAAPVIYSEGLLNSKDMGFEQQWREQTNTLESVGINVDWQVTDSFNLTLDAHDSSMESLPTGPAGGAGEIALSMAGPVGASQTVDYSGDLPAASYTINDSRGNNNGVFDAGDLGSQVARIWYAGQNTDVEQVRLEGTFDFDDGRISFGVDSRSVSMTQQNSNREMVLGNWGVNNPGEIPESYVESFCLTCQFDDYDVGEIVGFRSTDIPGMAEYLINQYADSTGNPDYQYMIEPLFTTNNTIEEDINALYVEFETSGSLGDMGTNLLVGLRYEDTDVTSSSQMRVPQYFQWSGNNDFFLQQSDEVLPVTVDASYDHLLPSVDFNINFTDDLVGRISYSKTIARAGYGNLAASSGGFGMDGGSTLLGAVPQATSNNPELKPLESDNVDISVEWYYADSSYASVGVFDKRVKNFVGIEKVDQEFFGMRNVTSGARAQAALAALQDLGAAVNNDSLYAMTVVLSNPQDFPNGVADYQYDPSTGLTDPDFYVDIESGYNMIPNDSDDPTTYLTDKPVNQNNANIYGAEFALQHFFGDTGFGVQANYTLVRGDLKFDNAAPITETQFALLGLSDSANLVAMYENYGFDVRLAYNWRDKFLNETGRGGSSNPVYVEAYSQIDLNVGYDITENFNVFFEGINLNGENVRHHARTENMPWYLEELGPRYQLGARYTF